MADVLERTKTELTQLRDSYASTKQQFANTFEKYRQFQEENIKLNEFKESVADKIRLKSHREKAIKNELRKFKEKADKNVKPILEEDKEKVGKLSEALKKLKVELSSKEKVIKKLTDENTRIKLGFADILKKTSGLDRGDEQLLGKLHDIEKLLQGGNSQLEANKGSGLTNLISDIKLMLGAKSEGKKPLESRRKDEAIREVKTEKKSEKVEKLNQIEDNNEMLEENKGIVVEVNSLSFLPNESTTTNERERLPSSNERIEEKEENEKVIASKNSNKTLQTRGSLIDDERLIAKKFSKPVEDNAIDEGNESEASEEEDN